MRYIWFIFTLFLFSLNSYGESERLEFVIIDGQYVLQRVPITKSTMQSSKEPIITVPSSNHGLHLVMVDQLYPETIKTLKYLVEGSRAAEIKAEAEKRAREALEVSNAKYAIVPVIAR